MAVRFCTEELNDFIQLIRFYRTFILTICVLHLVFAVAATLGNLLVIRALWKASSIPANLKKLFLSLAFSDLAAGLFGQLMIGVLIAVLLKMTTNGNYGALCPTALTIASFLLLLLGYASFLTVTAIAVDRLLAISLHLRYQELVTSKHVIIALVCLWITSGASALISVWSPNRKRLVLVIIALAGHLLTTVAYFRIYRVVRYHRNRIQSQRQVTNAQERKLLREKKSAFNSLFVYIVFLGCYLPNLCSEALLLANGWDTSFVVAKQVTAFLVFLNSSLNTVVYCWRYREIRELIKSTVEKMFRTNDSGTRGGESAL